MLAGEFADDRAIKAQQAVLDEAQLHLTGARTHLVLALEALDLIDGRSHLAARCQEVIDLIDAE